MITVDIGMIHLQARVGRPSPLESAAGEYTSCILNPVFGCSDPRGIFALNIGEHDNLPGDDSLKIEANNVFGNCR